MERNPEWRGEAPAFDEIQFIKYGTDRRRRARARPGRGRLRPRGRGRRPSSASASRTDIETRAARRRPSYTQLAFNLCSAENCPDAQVQPGGRRTSTVRQAIAYAIDRERINEIADPRHLVRRATGSCPSFYKSFYESPGAELPVRPRARQPDPRRRRLGLNDDGVREKDGEALSFDLYVRSESHVHDPDGEADRRADAARSGSSSTSRWSAPTSSPS